MPINCTLLCLPEVSESEIWLLVSTANTWPVRVAAQFALKLKRQSITSKPMTYPFNFVGFVFRLVTWLDPRLRDEWCPREDSNL